MYRFHSLHPNSQIENFNYSGYIVNLTDLSSEDDLSSSSEFESESQSDCEDDT